MSYGTYYLHSESGDLIYKHAGYEYSDDGPRSFVRKIWPVNTNDRGNAWTIVLEALALGANRQRVGELCRTWGCDEAGLVEAEKRVAFTPLMTKGAELLRDEFRKERGQ